MKIIAIRHAKCMGLDKQIINGWADYQLTENGKKEATNLGKSYIKRHPDIKIDEVYTSYLSRTYDTAKCFLEAMGIKKVSIDKCLALNERHYGFFQGISRVVARTFKEYNSLSESYTRLDNRLISIDDEEYEKEIKEYMKKLKLPKEKVLKLVPKSESIKDVEKRVNKFIDSIFLKKNKNKTILIVTHANPIKLITKRVENLNYKQASNLRFATCGMKIYDFAYDEKNKKYVLKNIENINKEWIE